MAEDTSNKNRIETKARLDPQLHEMLRERAFKQNVSHQEVMVAALTAYLNGPVAAIPPRPGKNADYHAMLDTALETEDAQTIKQLLRMATRTAAQPTAAKAKKAG